MFHHYIVDNSPVVHNGIELRFHQLWTMFAQERFLTSVFMESVELVAPGCGYDRCPAGPQQCDISYDDLPADLTDPGHISVPVTGLDACCSIFRIVSLRSLFSICNPPDVYIFY